MKKQLNIKQLEELKFKYEWCKTIQEFINAHDDDTFDVELMRDLDSEYAEQNPSLHDYLIRVLYKAYIEQNLVGLRSSINDYNEAARELPPEQFTELNRILNEKFGEDLIHNRKKELAQIRRIVKRGKINNEDEYRLVKSRIDELLWMDDSMTECKILDSLLCDYEELVKESQEQ